MNFLGGTIRKKAYFAAGSFPGMEFCVRPWRGVGGILCYHRVLPRESVINDMSPNRFLAVSEESFDHQMRHLVKNYDVISMDEMVARYEKGPPRFGVVVTFDDGYKDNLRWAYPILKAHRIPALIYITTRFLEGDTRLWWFTLWRHILEINHVRLVVDKKELHWNVGMLQEKRECFEEIRRLLLKNDKKGQEAILSQVVGDRQSTQYPDLCLSPKEIQMMDREGLVAIGSHCHSHDSLASLSENDVFYEISRSKGILEALLEKPVRHLAYPYGNRGDASRREAIVAERSGFKTGVTTVTGLVNRKKDPYLWPRLLFHEGTDSKMMDVLLSGFSELTGKAPR